MTFLEDLKKRILIMDGAMATTIKSYHIPSKYFLIKGNYYETLNLSYPELIKNIHQKYIEAGADILKTNTFNCSNIALQNPKFIDMVYTLSKEGAKIARESADISMKKIYVAGSIGPTNTSLSKYKNLSEIEKNFNILKSTYYKHINGLIDGGVDILLIETIYDYLNAQCIISVIEDIFHKRNIFLPVMLSFTINKNGKIFTGQDIKYLVCNLDRKFVVSFGFNCSFDSKGIKIFIKLLESLTTKPISLHPNAGFPDINEYYPETPEIMLENLKSLIENSELNLIGGCCGTSFEHIRKLSIYSKNKTPRNFTFCFDI